MFNHALPLVCLIGTFHFQCRNWDAKTASSQMASIIAPPEVSVTLLETKNLESKVVPWRKVKLPIDILLLTVKDCEFMSCISFLNPGSVSKSYCWVGFVYFGDIGEDESTKLRVGLLKCHPGSFGPSASYITVRNACEVLGPKAIINVGCCSGLNETKVKLGDVVVPAKLITYGQVKHTETGIEEMGEHVPSDGKLVDLICTAGKDWEPPLKNVEELEVKVHSDGALPSGPWEIASTELREELLKRYPEGIAIDIEGAGKSLAVVLPKG